MNIISISPWYMLIARPIISAMHRLNASKIQCVLNFNEASKEDLNV